MTTALARVYNVSFDRSPAGTLAVTNGLLSGFADIVAQATQIGLAHREASKESQSALRTSASTPRYEPRIPTYDPQRTVRFLVFGTCMGPILARWNQFLEVTFPLRSAVARGVGALPTKLGNKPITAAGAVGRAEAATSSSQGKVNILNLAKRVGSDQAVMAPLGLAVFLGSMGVMEGHGSEAIKKKYVDLFPPAIVTNWKVWPVIQFVNFRFMPLPYRVPFQATCGVFWTLYLSLLNSSPETKAEAAASDLRNTANKAADAMVEAAKDPNAAKTLSR